MFPAPAVLAIPWTAVVATPRGGRLGNGGRGVNLRRKGLVRVVAAGVRYYCGHIVRSHGASSRPLCDCREHRLDGTVDIFSYRLIWNVFLVVAVLDYVWSRREDGMNVCRSCPVRYERSANMLFSEKMRGCKLSAGGVLVTPIDTVGVI